jgi:hypothetical protein
MGKIESIFAIFCGIFILVASRDFAEMYCKWWERLNMDAMRVLRWYKVPSVLGVRLVFITMGLMILIIGVFELIKYFL